MKDYGQEISTVAMQITKLMSEARKEVMINNYHLARCPECVDFRREMRGMFEVFGCACPESPICGYFTQNEVQKEKFLNFACPCGRPIEENVEGGA